MAYRLKELKNVEMLKRDLNEKVLRYTPLEIKNITIDDNRISQEVVFLFL